MILLFELPYRLMISKAILMPITGIRHPFFFLSCLTSKAHGASLNRRTEESDLLSVIPHSKWGRGSISLSFPQGKADTKSHMDGNRWAWLPSCSCVACLCLPKEAYLSRAALCWHQAVPHLYQRKCLTCLETGGRGKTNGMWGFMEFKVLLSSCNVSFSHQSLELACAHIPQS